jgi:RNA polymerase sigma factor (sigma-70 family)
MLAIAPTLDMAVHADRPMTLQGCYQRHRDDVYRLCLRYGGGRTGWAEDVTHDVFVKLLEQLPRLENVDDLGGWLYRVAANLSISRLRREQSAFSRLRWFSPNDESDRSAALLFEQHEDAAAAMAAIRSLPARERVVLCMKVLDGKNQKEIAETLSMSEGYVSKLLARAWARVRAAGWEANDVRA